MRIGFDAKRIFQNTTGLGNYSRSVVKNLADLYPENEYYLFTPTLKNKLPFKFNNNTHMVTGRGSVWRSFGIRRDIVKHNIDVFHGLSNELPFTLKISNIRSVVTIHDLIFDHFPQYYPGVDRKFYDLKSKFAVRNSDMIIAASEATKRDIVHFYNYSPNKIKVIYQSCDDVFYQQYTNVQINNILSNYKLPSEYILNVGSITERKNLLNICKAYLLIPKQNRVPCVVVGNGKEYGDKVKSFIAEQHLEKYFIFLENVPTDHLPSLYKKAILFIYPSLYEGFGIPVLEALVSGCPVITSGVSSLPEVGGNAALYFDPKEPADIAAKITVVIAGDILRNEMIQRGFEHIHAFEKSKITEKVMDVYRQVAK